jgi:hypothetical protein
VWLAACVVPPGSLVVIVTFCWSILFPSAGWLEGTAGWHEGESTGCDAVHVPGGVCSGDDFSDADYLSSCIRRWQQVLQRLQLYMCAACDRAALGCAAGPVHQPPGRLVQVHAGCFCQAACVHTSVPCITTTFSRKLEPFIAIKNKDWCMHIHSTETVCSCSTITAAHHHLLPKSAGINTHAHLYMQLLHAYKRGSNGGVAWLTTTFNFVGVMGELVGVL